ncbi:ABC transmembrane type-1 domain-containing protein, partial [Trichostrongylus colubriformis]
MSQNAPDAMAALDYRIMINVSNMTASVIALIVAFIFSWQIGLLGAALSCSLLILFLLNMRITYKWHGKKEKEDRSSE